MAIEVRAPITGLHDVEALERAGAWADVLPARHLYELLSAAAASRPDEIALTHLPNGDPGEVPLRFSFGRFLERVTQAANAFHALGVGRGDMVACLLPNLPQTQFAMWGAAAAGVFSPINYLLRPEQLAELLETTGARVLVALGPDPHLDVWDKIEALRGRVPALETVLRVGPGEEGLDFDELLDAQPADRLLGPSPSRGDLAICFHTGGTTGSPKLAPHTHGNDLYCAWAAAQMWHYHPGGRLFHVLPMFHVGGTVVTSIAAVAAGMELVVPSPVGLRHPTALHQFWRLVERYRPTHIGGVPTHLVALLDVPRGDADIRSIEHTLTGAAPLPAEVEEAWNRTFRARISQMYGMTEAGSALAATPVRGPAKPGSAGFRLPWAEFRIAAVDGGGRPAGTLGPNEKGLILFRSPGVFPGYLDAAQNDEVFTDDGWLVTGDLGHLDEEGWLFITGRAKDVIIRSGHNIDPALIEEALAAHPAVALAAAVGRPDAYAGEVPVAYVQLKPGCEASPAGLRAFAAERIAERPALPREVFIVDEMPLTSVGKIFKPELRRRQAAEAVREALAELDTGGSWTIESAADERGGLTVRVGVPGIAAPQRPELAGEIGRRLGRFPLRHEILWA